MRPDRQTPLTAHAEDTTHGRAAGQEHCPQGNTKNWRPQRGGSAQLCPGKAAQAVCLPHPASSPAAAAARPCPPHSHTAAPRGAAHGPPPPAPARALPAHAQAAHSAHTPLRARWFLPGPGVPPSRPPGGWFLPGPIISALPNSRLPPLRENTRPTIWRLTKQLQRRLPQSAALRFPPRRLAHGRSPSAPSPCAGPGPAALPLLPPRLRTDRPSRPPRRPPGFTHVVGAAERGWQTSRSASAPDAAAGLMAAVPPALLPPAPASGVRGRASGRWRGRAARGGGYPALGTGLLPPPGTAHSWGAAQVAVRLRARRSAPRARQLPSPLGTNNAASPQRCADGGGGRGKGREGARHRPAPPLPPPLLPPPGGACAAAPPVPAPPWRSAARGLAEAPGGTGREAAALRLRGRVGNSRPTAAGRTRAGGTGAPQRRGI